MERASTYIHLLVVEITYVVRQMRLEAARHVRTASISSAEKGIVPTRPINASSFSDVVNITEDGNIDGLVRITTVVHGQFWKRKNLFSVLCIAQRSTTTTKRM